MYIILIVIIELPLSWGEYAHSLSFGGFASCFLPFQLNDANFCFLFFI